MRKGLCFAPYILITIIHLVFCKCSPITNDMNDYKVQVPTWYLSSKGDDTVACGSKISAACKTLDWLLGRFYNTSYKTDKELLLATDISLTINKDLMRNHPRSQKLSVVASVLINVETTDIRVEFTDVTLTDSHWTLDGFNLVMNNSNLGKSKILMKKTSDHQVKKIVNISNSTFGGLKVCEGFQITVSKYITNENLALENTLLDTTNCDLKVINSVFRNIKKAGHGAAVINAAGCLVEVQNITCSDNSALDALIQIVNASELRVQKSVFENNQLFKTSLSIIVVQNNSSAMVSDCVFIKNTAYYGACMYSDQNTTVIVSNSTFICNKAAFGGAIYWQDMVNSSALQRDIPKASNSSDWGYVLDWQAVQHNDLNLINTSSYVMASCYFTNNTALFEGTLYFRGSLIKINITDCDFLQNVTNETGNDIYITGEREMIETYVSSSCFVDNVDYLAGNLWTPYLSGNIFIERTKITIYNSSFLTNTDDNADAIMAATNYSIINIRHCFFESGLSDSIDIQDNVILNVEDCKFTDATMRATDNCSVTISGSYFTSVVQSPSDVFSIDWNSNMTVTDSLFESTDGMLLRVVTASFSSRMNFINCTFHKISGFQAEYGTQLTIRKSRIIGCINTTGFIEMQESHLHLSDCNITDNYLLETKPFVYLESRSSLSLLNCLYLRNTMYTHFETTVSSHIIITSCQFVDNTIEEESEGNTDLFLSELESNITILHCIFLQNYINSSAHLMALESSTISIKESVFVGNIIPEKRSLRTLLIWISASKHSYVDSNNFTNNYVDTVLDINAWLTSESYITIDKCFFTNNSLDSIHAEKISSLAICRTKFHMFVKFRKGIRRGIYTNHVQTVRIWESVFYALDGRPQLYFENIYHFFDERTQLFTLKSSFILSHKTLETDSPDFVLKAKLMGMINGSSWQHKETTYAATVPIRCQQPFGDSCFCHYDVDKGANIYNCTSVMTLISSVPNFTDWVLLENNNIQTLLTAHSYIYHIHYLSLKSNIITFINDSFLSDLSQSKSLKWLNLANNNLERIPKKMQNLTNLEKIWLAGNPFHCDCEMSWIIGWLNNFTTPARHNVIVDYQDLKCHSGEMKGKQIYTLNEVEMGCYPSKWTMWQKVGVGIGGIFAIVFLILLLLAKQSSEARFLMFYYLKLDTVPKDDKMEDVENMEYDAFFCYSHKDTKWVSEVFMKNKKKRSRKFDLERDYGFRLTIHNRDWIAGRTIRANIMDSLERSRRVIFLFSRNFLKSKWGMEEFMMADAEAVSGRNNFIIICLKEKLKMSELTRELRTYMQTHTYIDATKNIDKLVKRLRFAMPHTPLRELKPELFENERVTDSEDEYDESDLEDFDLDDAFPLMEPRKRHSVFYDTDESSDDVGSDVDDNDNDDDEEDIAEDNDVIVHAAFDDVSDTK